MIKQILKFLSFLTSLFLLFWFLNNGFLVEPVWQPIQAAFFAGICCIFFKYRKIKLSYWFIFIGFLYLVSAVLEIFKVLIYPEIAASSGFGVLVILIISRVFRKDRG